jgi:hypothetical protein
MDERSSWALRIAWANRGSQRIRIATSRTELLSGILTGNEVVSSRFVTENPTLGTIRTIDLYSPTGVDLSDSLAVLKAIAASTVLGTREVLTPNSRRKNLREAQRIHPSY